jgi:thioredoxin-related protein
MAEEQNKKILMIFTSDHCSWCKKLKNTLSDPKVIEALDNYIICYVDIKDFENKNLIKKYNIKSIPSAFILDKKENIIKNHIGYQNADQLINWLKN